MITTIQMTGIETLRRTWLLVRASLTERAGRAVFAATTVGYLVLYLGAVQDLSVTKGPWAVETVLVTDPLARAVQRTSYYQFEPIAEVTLGPVSYLFSPGNVAVGLGVAVLVGVNLAVTLYTRRQPAACSTRTPAGAIAGLPALLSGSACCGPLLLIVLGVQATATMLTVFRILLPAATVLLVLSLLYLGRQADESALGTTTGAAPS